MVLTKSIQIKSEFEFAFPPLRELIRYVKNITPHKISISLPMLNVKLSKHAVISCPFEPIATKG